MATPPTKTSMLIHRGAVVLVIILALLFMLFLTPLRAHLFDYFAMRAAQLVIADPPEMSKWESHVLRHPLRDISVHIEGVTVTLGGLMAFTAYMELLLYESESRSPLHDEAFQHLVQWINENDDTLNVPNWAEIYRFTPRGETRGKNPRANGGTSKAPIKTVGE